MRLTARSIATPRVVRLLGSEARIPANDEPDAMGDLSEADLLAIDKEFGIDKASGAIDQRQADRAQAIELQRWRCGGYL